MTAPPLIPDHTLLRPIGRGAYGEVWLARNVMGALRAVKVIRRGQFDSERPYEREFAGIQRYEPVSRTSGGLVHMLHVGRNDTEGYFYYVMELADPAKNPKPDLRPAATARQRGESPKETQNPNTEGTGGCDEAPILGFGLSSDFDLRDSDSYQPRTLRSDFNRLGRLPTSDCLRLALDVVSGLAQLHRHQLIHRDVKPGNIIYVGGRAKLADIGLVTAPGEECRTFVGTEGYIPPEGPGSPAADLYALGVVLYEATTGRAPEEFPDVPAEWFAGPGGEGALELHEIILKACEGQAERRYRSADDMQADLALLQSGRSIRHVRALERRYARLRLFGVVGTTLLVCALLATLFANYRARLAAESQAREAALHEQAQHSLTRAEAAEHQARQQLYTALLEQARATVRSRELGQRHRTLETVQRAGAISNSAALRQAAFAALALPDLLFEGEITFAQDDGRMFDSTLERYAVCMDHGPVEIHATPDGRLLVSLPAVTNALGYVKYWSPNGDYLAIKRDVDGSGERADLEVWNLVSTQRVLHVRDCVTERALCFHPSLPQIATSRMDGSVTVWDLERRQQIRQFELPATAAYWLCFAPDGERIAASYDHAGSHLVAIIDATTGAVQTTIPCLDIVLCLAWQPHGRWIAAPDYTGNVRLIDPKTGEARILGQHKAQAVDVDFSPGGDFLISGGWERELICWDMHTLQRSFTIGLNSNRAQFSSDGRRLAIYMADRLQIYAFQNPIACRELPEDLGRSLFRGAFSPEGRWFAAGGSQFMGVWDLRNGGPAATVPTGEGQAGIPFFSPTAPEIYAYGSQSLARWHLALSDKGEGPELRKLPLVVPQGLQCASIRSNEVVSTCFDGVRFMPLGNTNAENLRHLSKAAGWGEVSPDGRWLAVRGFTAPLLRVYRLPEVEEAMRLTNRAEVCGFAFSPSRDELAVITSKGLEFYDTTRWQRTRELPIQCERFASVRYAPDGESFWLTSDRRTSALRNTRTLEVLLPLPSGTTPLAVSPDGRHLGVSVDLRRVQLWNIAEVRERLRELGLDWPNAR